MKIKIVKYRGYEITVSVQQTNCGTLYKATNNYGEPYMRVIWFATMEEAIGWDKKNLDELLDQ